MKETEKVVAHVPFHEYLRHIGVDISDNEPIIIEEEQPFVKLARPSANTAQLVTAKLERTAVLLSTVLLSVLMIGL